MLLIPGHEALNCASLKGFMARNRRNQSAAIRFGPAIKALILCLVLGGSGVGYVWQKNQIYALGQQKKRCELTLDELRRQNRLRTEQLNHLKLPPVLGAKVKEFNLGLVEAQPEQILRLYEAPPKPTTPTAERQYAERRDRSLTSQ